MDSLRGNFGTSDTQDDEREYDIGDDETGHEPPPAGIGTDERRMQVRAYNHWAGQLDDRNFPSIDDLEPDELHDFGPFSVLLDFTAGIEDPAVQYLGASLAEECGTDSEIAQLSDVPSRSLLSRITDHYMQILANQAPIGFEAEFVNQRNATILYRGILLPYSSDGDAIDYIYGVINWKEMADQVTADELLLEIDQALEPADQPLDLDDPEASAPVVDDADPVTDWADGPSGPINDIAAASIDAGKPGEFPQPHFGTYDHDEDEHLAEEEEAEEDAAIIGRLSSLIQPRSSSNGAADTHYAGEDHDEDFGEDFGDAAPTDHYFEEPADIGEKTPVNDDIPHSPLLKKKGAKSIFPVLPVDTADVSADYDDEEGEEETGFDPAADAPSIPQAFEPSPETPANDEIVTAAVAPATPSLDAPESGAVNGSGSLHDCLAEARQLAQLATSSEDRTRHALYQAVGRAYDVCVAASESPDEFAELVEDNGLTIQDRAPMTPVVKLVFGADYDKTRLAEYATVLSHAQRAGIERGGLADFLSKAEGGLKGVVKTERRIKREESGKTVDPLDAPRPAIAKKLRKIDGQSLDSIDSEGPEFGVVMIRRLENGEIVVLGEVADDIPLVEKVARKIIG